MIETTSKSLRFVYSLYTVFDDKRIKCSFLDKNLGGRVPRKSDLLSADEEHSDELKHHIMCFLSFTVCHCFCNNVYLLQYEKVLLWPLSCRHTKYFFIIRSLWVFYVYLALSMYTWHLYFILFQIWVQQWDRCLGEVCLYVWRFFQGMIVFKNAKDGSFDRASATSS